MIKPLDWLSKIRFRKTLTLFLTGIVFFLSTACASDQAVSNTRPTTPEAGAYQTDLKGVDRSVSDKLSQANQPLVVALAGVGDNSEKLPRNRDQAAERAINNAARAGDNQFAKPNESTGNVLDDVREKLNLDEPIYPATKEVLNDVRSTAKDVVQGTQQAVEDTAKGTQQAVEDTVKSR